MKDFVTYYVVFLCLGLIPFTNIQAANPIKGTPAHKFSSLLPENKLETKSLQVKDESISVHLYKGFATVKALYTVENKAGHEVSLRVGYPTNVPHNQHFHGMILLDSLCHVMIKADDKFIPYTYLQSREKGKKDNWYMWRVHFKEKTSTQIAIYSIIKTQMAVAETDKGTIQSCGFRYALDNSGAWPASIANGRMNITLMDGLDQEDIVDLYPSDKFQTKGNKLIWDFRKNAPMSSQIVQVDYKGTESMMQFKHAMQKHDAYYRLLDREPSTRTLHTKTAEGAIALQSIQARVGMFFDFICISFLCFFASFLWFSLYFIAKLVM